MSDSCTTSATATLYSTQYSVVVQTAFSNNYVNGSRVQSTYLQTSTVEEAIPTETLYGSSCEAAAITTPSTKNRGKSVMSTAVLPTSTATYVNEYTAANDGGSVVYVTSFSTISATSVFVVYETKSNTSPTATSTTLQSNSHSSSSSHAGAIAGGIVAAVILIALLAILAWWLRKRSRRDRDTRALDDFFKDALNPGEAGGVAGGALAGGGTMSTRRSTMRRKSSLVLDLEKEKNLSHSNDEDNWAALTRISSSVGGHEDNYVDSHSRPQSRISFNAISRGASVRSYGIDDVYTIGDGEAMTDGPLVEEPEALNYPPASPRSRTSLGRSPYEDHRPQSAQRMTSQLSSRSADHPAQSPGLTSLQSTSTGNTSPHSEECEGMFPLPQSAYLKNGRAAHNRIHHHLSMSGIYPLPIPLISPGPNPPIQSIPERPKSALGIMAIPGPHSPRLRNPSLQSVPRSPTSLHSRASITGYGHYNPSAQYSPPLRPIRVVSAKQIRPGFPQTHFKSELPPSRYSHLDIVKQDTEAIGVTGDNNTNRQRSLSGSILVKMTASLSDDAAVNDSDPSSSTSASLKTPEMTRNPSAEEAALECASSNEDITTDTPGKLAPSIVVRSKSPLNGRQRRYSIAEDGSKKPNFWQPHAWRARAN